LVTKAGDDIRVPEKYLRPKEKEPLSKLMLPQGPFWTFLDSLQKRENPLSKRVSDL